jgi:hypothetical protein
MRVWRPRSKGNVVNLLLTHSPNIWQGAGAKDQLI